MTSSELILITDSFYPYKDSTSKINTTIVNYLSNYKKIRIICIKNFFSNQPFFNNSLKNISIIRLPVPFANTRSIPLKLIKFISFSILIVISLIFQKKDKKTFLISTSPPIIIPFIIFFLELRIFKKNKTKKILLAQDIYPDIIGEVNNSKKILNLSLKFLNYLYKNVYKKFDLVLSCCEPIKSKLVTKYKLPTNKIKVINNWSLISQEILDNFNPPSLTSKNEINMFLIGNVGKVHLYKQTSMTLRNILLTNSLIKGLQMYTSGAHHYDIYESLKDLKNVYLHKPVNADQLAEIYSKPSLTIVPLTQIASRCAFPSRIATAISLGSPLLVITDNVNDNNLVNYVLKKQIGLVISNPNIKREIEKTVDDLISNFNVYQENCINLYAEEFLMKNNLKKFLDSIQKLNAV
tara:strand:+ start:3252 stop:4475 length:1224 start_codon:yes stop_codon:yes gene_type:complete